MKQQIFSSKAITKRVFSLSVLIMLPSLHLLAGPRGLSDPTGAPIDGGISLLVAAGIGYGAKKVRDARRKSNRAQAEQPVTNEK